MWWDIQNRRLHQLELPLSPYPKPTLRHSPPPLKQLQLPLFRKVSPEKPWYFGVGDGLVIVEGVVPLGDYLELAALAESFGAPQWNYDLTVWYGGSCRVGSTRPTAHIFTSAAGNNRWMQSLVDLGKIESFEPWPETMRISGARVGRDKDPDWLTWREEYESQWGIW